MCQTIERVLRGVDEHYAVFALALLRVRNEYVQLQNSWCVSEKTSGLPGGIEGEGEGEGESATDLELLLFILELKIDLGTADGLEV